MSPVIFFKCMTALHKKMKFSIKDLFSMCEEPLRYSFSFGRIFITASETLALLISSLSNI